MHMPQIVKRTVQKLCFFKKKNSVSCARSSKIQLGALSFMPSMENECTSLSCALFALDYIQF